MPTYKVKDSLTGKTLNLTGDSPPTEEELQYIFSQHSGFDAPLQQEDEDEEARLTEETIRKDPRWIELSKKVYEMNEGPDAVPLDNDEQAASYGLDYMGWFNYNLPKMGLEAAQLQSATDDQKKAFVDLMDMYDEKAPSLAGFGRAVRGVAFDPATYVGIGTFGAATAGTQALKQGIKEGVKQATKAGMVQGAKVGAIEAGAYSAADNALRQSVRIQAGEQEGFDFEQSAKAAAIGAGAGGVLGGALGGIGARAAGKVAEADRAIEAEKIAYQQQKTDPASDVLPNLSVDRELAEQSRAALGNVAEEATPRLSMDLTGVAADAALDFLQRAGIPAASNMRITEQISDVLTIVHKDEKLSAALADTLKKFDFTTQEFANLFKADISDSARQLAKMSQISKSLERVSEIMSGQVPKEPMGISILSRFRQGAQDLDNVRRGLLVSQIATTMRNFTAQVGRVGMHSMVEGVDFALNKAFNPVRRLFGQEERHVDHTNTFRLFSNLTTDKKYAKEITDALTKMYKGQEDRLFTNYVSDVADASNNKTFKTAAKATDFFNYFNRMQEYFYRRGMFAASLERTLSKKGINLRELYESNRLGDIDIKDVERAVDDALEFTYAKMPEGALGKSFVTFANSIPFVTTAIFPFARFMSNAVEFQFKHSPLGPLALLSKKERDAVARGDSKIFAQTMVGSAALLAMIEAKRKGFADDGRWYEIEGEDGQPFDMRPYFPLTPYLLVADLVVRSERNLAPPNSKDILQGLTGAQFRAGAGLSLVDNLIDDLSGLKKEDKITNVITRFTSDVLGGFLTPLRMFGDFTDSLPEEYGGVDKQTFRTSVPEGKPDVGYISFRDIGKQLQSSIPVVNREGFAPLGIEPLPELESPTRAAPRGRPEEFLGLPAPMMRQLTGLTVGEQRNPAEREFERLGLKTKDIRPYTGSRKADMIMDEMLGPMVENIISPIVESERYQSQSNVRKRVEISGLLTKIRAAATAQAKAKDPMLFYKVMKKRMPEYQRRLIKEANPSFYEQFME